MMERRYTGIAKQGADVVANPTLDGSEQALNSIQINGENFKIEGGGSGKLKKIYEKIETERTAQAFSNTPLEIGKLYLLQVYCDMEKTDPKTTLVYISSDTSFSSSVMFDYNNSTNFYAYCSPVEQFVQFYTANDDIEYDVWGLEVYELEFGGSSGGGEKDSYEFWKNYANNILCYQNSNEKGKYISGSVTYEVNSNIEIENYGILNNIENATTLSLSLDGFMYVDKTMDEFSYFDDYRIGGTFYIGNCTLYSEERSVYAHCYISVSDGNVYIDFDDGSKITLLPETLQTNALTIYDIINNRHYEF